MPRYFRSADKALNGFNASAFQTSFGKQYALARSLLLIFCLQCCFSGCFSRGTGSVEGRVLIDGKPIQGIEVTFHSVDGSGEGFGMSGENGQYILYRGRGNRELLAGEYKVTLSDSGIDATNEGSSGTPKPIKLPDYVTDFEQSKLMKFVEKGKNVIDIIVDTSL